MKITALSTLKDRVEPDFSCEVVDILSDRMGRLGEELAYLIQWVYPEDSAKMNARLFSVIQHLSRVQHQWILEIADKDLECLATWGRKSNAIFALPDETLRDPDGALLVEGGQADSPQAVPWGSVPYPQDAVERGLRNRELLGKQAIVVTPDLPPILGMDEVNGKSADEVAWRTLALFVVAVRAESIATKQPLSVEQLRAKSPMAFEVLTPREQMFMSDQNPDSQTVAQFAWRYEALYALQWALGMHDQMSFPDNICDVPRVAETMVDRPDREIVVDSRLRPVEDLLDAADLNYQLLWAARQAHMDGNPPPAKMDGGVLVERQHALNWLLQLGEAAWDDVDTPT